MTFSAWTTHPSTTIRRVMVDSPVHLPVDEVRDVGGGLWQARDGGCGLPQSRPQAIVRPGIEEQRRQVEAAVAGADRLPVDNAGQSATQDQQVRRTEVVVHQIAAATASTCSRRRAAAAECCFIGSRRQKPAPPSRETRTTWSSHRSRPMPRPAWRLFRRSTSCMGRSSTCSGGRPGSNSCRQKL